MRALLAVLCLAASVSVAVVADTVYVPQRVFAAATGKFSDFETMLSDMTRADVVFVGEEHDDLNTHRVELSLLEGLGDRRDRVVVSMEMFERDVQEPMAHFLTGQVAEADFLRDARPWSDYARDYKPLMDLAIAKEWPVVAANVPRAIAAEVSRSGIGVLTSKTGAEKAWFASDLRCPANDAYFHRFVEAMGGHDATAAGGRPDAGKTAPAADMTRYYEAQCLKDETMAESIARAYTVAAMNDNHPVVVSFNGAFHSDFGQGTVDRTKRRLSGRRVLILTIIPVPDLERVAPEKDARKRADYVIYTLKKK